MISSIPFFFLYWLFNFITFHICIYIHTGEILQSIKTNRYLGKLWGSVFCFLMFCRCRGDNSKGPLTPYCIMLLQAQFRFCPVIKNKPTTTTKKKKLEVEFNIGQVIPPHIRPTIRKLIPVALLILWNDWHVMPLCWQQPKCLPYLDCRITLSFISQFYPNANDTFTILYISQFSVAFLPLKTKYDFKGHRADRHRWENDI